MSLKNVYLSVLVFGFSVATFSIVVKSAEQMSDEETLAAFGSHTYESCCAYNGATFPEQSDCPGFCTSGTYRGVNGYLFGSTYKMVYAARCEKDAIPACHLHYAELSSNGCQ